MNSLPTRRGDYGFDAPYAPLLMALGGAGLSFDVVVSSLAIHNISGAGERAQALREAARVLKKGGKLLIADIRCTRDYARELEACGLKITERRSLGVRFWYGAGPWVAMRLVAAIKP